MATLKNRADLLTEAATNLPDNTSQEISPQDVREMAENLAESNFNRVTDSALVGLKTYNTGVVYESGQGAIYSGNIYVANKTTTPGAFNPSDWDQVTAELGNVENTQTTGIISGGLISINADTTKFDLAAGKAVVVDNSDLTAVVISEISWTAQAALTAGNLATEPRTNLAISLTNEVLPNVTYTNSFTATVNGASQLIYIAEKSTDNFNSLERRKVANLGRLVHTAGTVITNAVNLQQHVNSVLNSFLDFVSLFPAQNVEGNEFSGKVGTLGVAKTAGKGFRFGSNYDTDTNDPNNQAIPAADPTTHFYRYQDGAGGFSQSAPLTVLDPANYDNGSGTLASVSPNRWTLQPVWVFAGSGTMFVQYGQTEFSTKEAAIGALPTVNPVLDQNLVNDAVFRGYFIIKQGATDLSDSTQFEWRAPLGEVGGGQGAGVVVDLQAAFNASFDPEITTDSTRGAFTIQRGSAADTDNVLEIKNGADAITFSVDGNGLVTGNGSGLTNIGNLENNLTNLGTLGAGQDGQALIWDNATSRFIMGSAGGATGLTAIYNTSGEPTFYASLSAAITAASAGDTVFLWGNITETGATEIVLKDGVNINLNGFTYEMSNASTTLDAFTDNNVAVDVTIYNGVIKRSGASGNTAIGLDIKNSNSKIKLEGVEVQSTFGYCIYNEGIIDGGKTSNTAGNFAVRNNGRMSNLINDGYGEYRQAGTTSEGYNIYSKASNYYGMFIDNGKIQNSYAESASNEAFFIQGGTAENCVGVSSASYGIRTNGAIKLNNCKGYSTASGGIFMSSSGAKAYYCIGESTANIGILINNGTNNAGIYNCTGVSSASQGIRVDNGSRAIDCVGISTLNTTSGHGFDIRNANDRVSNCYAEVTNSGAYGFQCGAVSPYLVDCRGRGMTTLINSGGNSQTSTADTYGNILLD